VDRRGVEVARQLLIAPARQHGLEDLILGVEQRGVAVDEERRSRSRDLPQPAHRTSGVGCNDARIMHQM
jgi:hypothetical protein